ncbi:hypothetical protein NUW54_g5517 [Trametes sanguinea]|uniref:Uncharacterized protein n=1 Tax=Trametes sanguinea TaxID=158606 RepID=A0ACC1PUX8_9APHY|nr:hypothetical protein NUW54_g5517 [Trametes sanguinea]
MQELMKFSKPYRQARDSRTWRLRLERLDKHWKEIMPSLVNAYLQWKYPGTAAASPSQTQTSTASPPADSVHTASAEHGGQTTSSVPIPYRRTIRNTLSDAFNIYLAILRAVNKRVFAALGRDTPDWRVKNACPACCYELDDEPDLLFSRLICMDGNNSLKRMRPLGGRKAGDTRVFDESDYFLPVDYVNKFTNEVPRRSGRRDDKAWQAYIKLEMRYNELDRASAIYERWVAVRPEPRVWVKWGKFEEERGKLDKAREVFQTALEFFGDDEEQIEKAQAVFNAFAKMETRLKEFERARVIYKFALSRLPRSKSAALYAAYTKFEKQHGTRTTLESTVLGKRRIQYEEELAHDGRNYDVWFDYARLEEGALRDLREEGATAEEEERAANRVREVYERAVAQVPPGGEKRHWRRYIFLWLFYALFEETETKDYERARQIYETAIRVVPHKQFTFAKLWIMFARFEVRQLNLQAARKILGTAIGMCPKEALFKGYIQLEFDLREFDRVRTLYEKYIEWDPTNSAAWIKYAELETQLEDFARVRAIYELGDDDLHEVWDARQDVLPTDTCELSETHQDVGGDGRIGVAGLGEEHLEHGNGVGLDQPLCCVHKQRQEPGAFLTVTTTIDI